MPRLCIGARSNDQSKALEVCFFFSLSFYLLFLSRTNPFNHYSSLSKHEGNSNDNGGGCRHDASTAGHGSGGTGTAERERAVIPHFQGHTVAEGHHLVGASLITNQALTTFCIIGQKKIIGNK